MNLKYTLPEIREKISKYNGYIRACNEIYDVNDTTSIDVRFIKARVEDTKDIIGYLEYILELSTTLISFNSTPKSVKIQEKIIEILSVNPVATMKEIAKKLGMSSTSNIHSHLQKMLKLGMLEKVGVRYFINQPKEK